VDRLLATKSEGVGLIVRAISFQSFQPVMLTRTWGSRPRPRPRTRDIKIKFFTGLLASFFSLLKCCGCFYVRILFLCYLHFVRLWINVYVIVVNDNWQRRMPNTQKDDKKITKLANSAKHKWLEQPDWHFRTMWPCGLMISPLLEKKPLNRG